MTDPCNMISNISCSNDFFFHHEIYFIALKCPTVMEIDKLPVCICRYPFPFRDLFFEILIKGTTSIAALFNNRFLFFQNQTEYFWTHYRYKLSILLGEKYYLATLKSLPDKTPFILETVFKMFLIRRRKFKWIRLCQF